jgi:hypothetical protein
MTRCVHPEKSELLNHYGSDAFCMFQEYYRIIEQNVFTFDIRTRTFVQDLHAHADFPYSLRGLCLKPGSLTNEIFLRGWNDVSDVMWSYQAFPDNKWERVLKVSGPFEHALLMLWLLRRRYTSS